MVIIDIVGMYCLKVSVSKIPADECHTPMEHLLSIDQYLIGLLLHIELYLARSNIAYVSL